MNAGGEAPPGTALPGRTANGAGGTAGSEGVLLWITHEWSWAGGAPRTMKASGRAGALAGPVAAEQDRRAGEGARAPAEWETF